MAARSASIASFLLLLLLVAVPSSSNHLKFNLNGHVFEEIYATVIIGEESKNRHEYNLHVDTGSILTWIQCNLPHGWHDCEGQCRKWRQPHLYYNLIPQKIVGSRDRLCESWLKPDRSKRLCKYEMGYVGGESSRGYLVKDRFTLRSNVLGKFAFGCGYDQEHTHERSPGDGVLGLGRTRSSLALTTQLKNAGVITKNWISHCFRASGGGFLFIGETPHPSGGISKVDMETNVVDGHYVAAVKAALHFEGNPNPISNHLMRVAFDSGTTYTYFDNEPFLRAVTEVKKHLNYDFNAPLREVRDQHLAAHLCWERRRPPHKFKSVDQVKQWFKTMALVFNSESTFEIPPENYLMISGTGNVCLAIVHDSNPHLRGLNLIGAFTMRNMIMIYDNDGDSIGWTQDCSKKRT